MWPELTLVYLFSLKVEGYRPGDPIGSGPHASLVLDMAYYPPSELTGKLISPENMVQIALTRIKERMNHEND